MLHRVTASCRLELLDGGIRAHHFRVQRFASHGIEWWTVVDEKHAENIGIVIHADVEPVQIHRPVAAVAGEVLRSDPFDPRG